MKAAVVGNDLYDTGMQPGGGGSGGGGVAGPQGPNGVSAHPLSSANPPGLPRPPLHPALSHSHGHSHLITPGTAAALQQNGSSPMQRLAGHPSKHLGQKMGLPHHGGHGPAPPPPTHISNPPTSSQHQMSNLSTGTSTASTASQHQQPTSQSLVSNGGLNGHATNMSGAQLFGDTEPENEKWWWVCCLEFCFCLL